jgi:acyl carrier protein
MVGQYVEAGPCNCEGSWICALIHLKNSWEGFVRDDILASIYAAIDELNSQSNEGLKIQKSLETPLLAKESGLDSLAFVNLIVAVEGQLETSLGLSGVLVDEVSMSLHEHPFRNVGTLARYVEAVIAKQGAN